MVSIVVLLLSFVFINAQEYYCDRDRFPLVTDFSADDCDNDNYYYYKENAIDDCFPGCVRTVEDDDTICSSVFECFPGYYCDANEKCILDETSCLKYYAEGSNYLAAKWKPDCLSNGEFAPKQCKGEPANGRCFCYDASGNRLFGQEFSYSAEDMTCACSRRRAEMENSGEYVFVSLHCDSMGNYDPLQCDIESESCWCVESKTGDLISSVVPLSLVTKLSCYNETTFGSQYLRQCESHSYAQLKITDEFNTHGTTKVNFQALACLYDGGYGPYTLTSSTIAYCVWKDNSYLSSYQSTFTSSTLSSILCYCAQDEKIFSDAGLTHTLTCEASGSYKSIQMDGDEYYCIDDDGFMISDLLAKEPSNCNSYYSF